MKKPFHEKKERKQKINYLKELNIWDVDHAKHYDHLANIMLVPHMQQLWCFVDSVKKIIFDTYDTFWPLQTSNTPQKWHFWRCYDPIVKIHHDFGLVKPKSLPIFQLWEQNAASYLIPQTGPMMKTKLCCLLQVSGHNVLPDRFIPS